MLQPEDCEESLVLSLKEMSLLAHFKSLGPW
jgi:hypothetical protein